MSNGKAMIIPSTVELMKKISLYQISLFLESYTHSIKKMKTELDLSIYATKSD